MLGWNFSTILFLASVGGLLLTLISGIHVVKPLVLDAEIVYFGFPSAWFEAARSGLFIIGSWRYYFLWHGFLIDFIFYGLLIAAFTSTYFVFLQRKQHGKPHLNAH